MDDPRNHMFAIFFSPWLTRPIARSFSDRQFRERQQDCERAVNEIRAQRNLTTANLDEIDLNKITLPAGVIAIRAARCEDGAVVAEFLVSAGGRVHQGYLFKGCEDPAVYGPNGRERRYRLRHLDGQWYHFSD